VCFCMHQNSFLQTTAIKYQGYMLPYLSWLSINNTVTDLYKGHHTLWLYSKRQREWYRWAHALTRKENTFWYIIKPKDPCQHCEHEKSSFMTVSL
jgi:hypothetical protein